MNGILISKEPFVFVPLPDGDPEATHEILRDDEANYIVIERKPLCGVKDAGHDLENEV